MHQRREILEFICAQLKTLDGFAGVWIQRIPPARASYPCITIYAEQETVETLTVHFQPRPQERLLNITVTGWIKGTPNDEKAERDMDNTALKIESVMILPPDTNDIQLTGTAFDIDEQEPDIHSVDMNYSVEYTSNELSPTN